MRGCNPHLAIIKPFNFGKNAAKFLRDFWNANKQISAKSYMALRKQSW